MPKKINLLGQRFGKLKVIAPAENHKGRTAWLCQCDCGNQKIITTKLLRDGTTKSCGCLKRKPLEGQKFGKLTVIKATDQRRHGEVVWECQCDCGNICYATSYGLKVGDNVSCGCYNKAREKFKKMVNVDLIGQKFGKLTVIAKTDMRTASRGVLWECQCDCGNICYVSTNHLQTNNTQSCGCLSNISIGEQEIKNLLDKNAIPYQREYKFPELPNRRYDFAIFDNNRNLIKLIEFDGEQHYKEALFFNKTLAEQQKIDKEKTQFAQQKGIKLIRIPYWKRNNIQLKDLEL